MTTIPQDMKLAALIQQWLEQIQLKAEIQLNPADGTSAVETPCEVGGEPYRLFVEADEKRHWLSLYMYGAKPIPAERYDEACKLANGINLRFLSLGRMAAITGKGFQFMALADVEGSVPSATMIKNMLDAGTHVFKLWSGAMGELIAGDKSAEQVFAEIEKSATSAE
jgi:hypothetical protein